MKKKIAILLAILILSTMMMTSCDEILSLIPGFGDPPDSEVPEIYDVTYIVDDYRINIDQVTEGFPISRPADPTRDGYAFEGWYTDEACTKGYDFSTIPTGNITLYAKWRQTSSNPGSGGGYDKPTHNCESICPECGLCLDAECAEAACSEKCKGHVPPHSCESICPECGLCLNAECAEAACSEKCQGHVPPHECESVCTECGLCLDAECAEEACADKCKGHVPPHSCESICTECGSCLDAECAEEACADKCKGHVPPHSCESICTECGSCLDAECAEDVCKEKCEGHTVEVKDTTIYLVGDSTVCSFSDDYFYPRYGWGTQLGGYLTEKATVVNLALSGRSSKSFTTEANYQTLIKNLKEGDYLFIAFGHNDEKSDDPTRFTDASLPYTDEASFGYHLYEYYIKIALEKGATPILVTPIVRAKSNNDYSGSEGHVTATGDYRQAIIDLGEAVSVDVIDMTAITRARYEELGYDEALKYHAVLQGKKNGEGVIENWDSVDKTHLNIYGAKYVAYRIACELMKLDGIKHYVAEGITEPTEAVRVPNKNYVVPDYEAPDLDNYSAPAHFSTETEGWYGTAFGDTGGSPMSASNGYLARETSEGVFEVGQFKSGSNKGKFSSTSDGFAFLFTQVEANKNFKISVTAKVLKTATTKQAGFGLMLRDDCLINQTAAGAIATNYLTAGIYADSDSKMMANFYRENGTFHKGKTMNGMYAVGDVVTFTIERIGQTVHVTTVYNNVTYTESYYDFDLFARDGGYMYVGMFANRGTVVEFTNLHLEITGESQGA